MGRIVLTRDVYEWTAANGDFAQFVQSSLKRHARGDWGNLSREDKEENEFALREGSLRLFSAYQHHRLPKIWIITEADRSVTTVLFPDDY
jgi:hypothetical protein